MPRIALIGRVALTMTLVGSAGLIGLVAWSSQPLPANDSHVDSPPKPADGDCPGCWNEEFILQTGNPEVDALARDAAHARAKASQQSRLEAARQKHVQKMQIWQGTKVVPDRELPETVRATYAAIAPTLAADPIAPRERSEMFANYLNGASEFKCVGWQAAIMEIVPRDDGWEATVHVRPHLERERGGIVFTPHVSVETWTLSDKGEVQFVKAVEEGNIGVFVD